jgi:hypothetical protein
MFPDVPPIDDRYLCGWRVRSEIPLVDLPLWLDQPCPPDISVRVGARLRGPLPGPGVSVLDDGMCCVHVPSVAVYAVNREATEITVSVAAGASPTTVVVFLSTTVLAVVCHLRGLLPLQATCVRVGDRAIVLAGRTGSGKSTLAAALLEQGCSVVADDVTVIATSDGVVRALPAFPRLRLWRDAMDRLGLPVEGTVRSHPELERHHIAGGPPATAPLPVHAVCYLGEIPDPRADGVRRLPGIEAIAMLSARLWLRAFVERFGARDALLAAPARLAGVPGGHWLLVAPRSPRGQPATPQIVLRIAQA